MANFLKGLAGGIETGARLGELMRQRQEREELAQAFAKPETFTDYTPEQQQQIQGLQTGGYDVQAIPGAEGAAPTLRYTTKQGLDLQGDTPVSMDIAPQQVQRYGGQTVAGQFDPAQLRGLQMREAARIVGAQGDALKSAQLTKQAEDIDYEQKSRPLQLQNLQGALDTQKLTQEAAGLSIAEQKRKGEESERMAKFNTAYGDAAAQAAAEGRTLMPNDISKLAQTHKLSFGQENELIAGHVNRSKAEVEQFRLDVEKATQGKNFEQLVDLHKNDKRFGDGMHFVPEIDKKTGGVVLARVNEATGKVEERMPFKTKAEATAYLREEAVNPANAAIWLQNYKKGQVGIEKDQAAIRASDSTVAYHGAVSKALGEQAKTPAAKLNSMATALGRPLTEDEKLQGLGLVPKPTAAKGLTDEAKSLVEAGHYKDVPTAIEALKRGSVRDKDRETWLKMEEKLVANDATPEVIAKQKARFDLDRGYAPPMAQQIIRQGIDPTTRKPLTLDDVTAYNQTYPQTPVTPAELPWLASEARRQGLITQIPR